MLKFVLFFLVLLQADYALACNDRLLDIHADTLKERICSGITTTQNDIMFKLDFFNETSEDVIANKYISKINLGEILKNEDIKKMSIHFKKFVEFSNFIQELYNNNESKIRVPIYLLFLKTAKKMNEYILEQEMLHDLVRGPSAVEISEKITIDTNPISQKTNSDGESIPCALQHNVKNKSVDQQLTIIQ